MSISRPAVRVVCVDGEYRLLLLKWRDPVSGSVLWEPPGGGIEAGETAYEAACRELREETGLRDVRVEPGSTPVVRDVWWAGHHFTGTELFFAAFVADTATDARELSGHEQVSLVGEAWFTWSEVCALDETVEPPSLQEVLTSLVPDGPWTETPAEP